MIADSEWKYCFHCEIPIVGCDYCNGTSCNGMSCEKCHEKHIESRDLIEEIRTRLFKPRQLRVLWAKRYAEHQKIPKEQRELIEGVFGKVTKTWKPRRVRK